MTRELDELKTAMDAASGTPDPTKRNRNLALAQKNFDALQGSRNDTRPKSDRPEWGLWTGVQNLLSFALQRALVTGSAVFVTAGLVFWWSSDLGVPLASVPSFSDSQTTKDTEILRRHTTDLAETPPAQDQAVRFQGARPVTAPGRTRDKAILASPERALRALPSAPEPVAIPQPDTEAYSNADSNPQKVTAQDPVSTFSIDVDTASYAIMRNTLLSGLTPQSDAVRVEEMINYFTYDYPAPEAGQAFRSAVSVIPTPWNEGTQLVHIGIQGAQITDRPPLNLVFLIDTSGSMQDANKLPLLTQSFALMLNELQPKDEVAIVTYAGNAGVLLAPTPASDQAKIRAALNTLTAGGATAGRAGLEDAYSVAAQMSKDGEVSRVILATDGDFNVGISDPEELKNYIADQRKSGTYLSVLGFGRGNLDDATMQALAQHGNGQAAYIDTLSEAQKVLVDQLSGALFPIADDVKIQVEFNPGRVAEYRLIGYETRALRREDFNNDRVDAGDIGAGHQVTALYEITPVGSEARRTDPLRYGTEPQSDASDELAFLRVRYKAPGETESRLIETPILSGQAANKDTDFAVAIAGFGQLLRGSVYLENWTWRDAISLAQAGRGEDPFGYRNEALRLMRLAESLTKN